MSRPSCSILIPIHKSHRWLQECLISVVRDCENTDEIILVVDSQDSSVFNEVAYRVNSLNIRNVNLQKSDGSGIVDALNYGLQLCKSEYIVRLDSDDMLYPNRLNTQIRMLMLNQKVAVVGGAIELIDENSNLISVKSYPTNPIELRKAMREGCYLAHPAVTFRKSAVQLVGGYCRDFQYAEDYDLWTRVLEKYDVANVPNIVTKYRQHSGQTSRSFSSEQTLLTELIRKRPQL